MSVSALSRWDSCPSELLTKIFLYLQVHKEEEEFSLQDKTDLVRASSTCRHWRRVGLDPRLWRHKTFRLPPLTFTQAHVTRYLQREVKYVDAVGHYAQYIRMDVPLFYTGRTRHVIDFLNTIFQSLSNRFNEESPILSFDITGLNIPSYRKDAQIITEMVMNILRQFMANQKHLRVLKINHRFYREKLFGRIIDCMLTPSFATTLQVLEIRTDWRYWNFAVKGQQVVENLMAVLKTFGNISHLGLSYGLLSAATLEGVCQSMQSLQKLTIYCCDEYAEGSIIPMTSWRAVCHMRPDLKVSFHLYYNLTYISNFLLDGIPLVQLVVKELFYRQTPVVIKTLLTSALKHLTGHFKRGLESFTLFASSDMQTPPPSLEDDIVQFLVECSALKQATFSRDLVSEDLKDQIKQDVFQRTGRDVSFLQVARDYPND